MVVMITENKIEKVFLDMKKTLLLLCLMVFFEIPAFSICDYVYFCPPHAYDLASEKKQLISRKTGATLLSEKIAQIRIKHELKKITKAKLDVFVRGYSFMDLIHGRFKSIIITGKNLDINGVHLTSLELKSLCDFNYIDWGKNPIVFKENMIIGFTTVISDADLMKTMNSNGYLDKLNCVNVHGCGITFFKLSGADVKIKNDKLYFTVKITSQLLLPKPIDVVLTTDLKAENGRIVMTKVDLGKLAKGVDLGNVASHLNSMNPLAFSLNVLENENTKMCIQKVKINEDKITLIGNIFIPRTNITTK